MRQNSLGVYIVHHHITQLINHHTKSCAWRTQDMYSTQYTLHTVHSAQDSKSRTTCSTVHSAYSAVHKTVQ